jgi:protein-tyrosine phosphatase
MEITNKLKSLFIKNTTSQHNKLKNLTEIPIPDKSYNLYRTYMPYNLEFLNFSKSNITDVFVLTQEDEFSTNLENNYKLHKINFHHYPIDDFEAPTDSSSFSDMCEQIHKIAQTKKRKVMIHCMGGNGRTGVVLACILKKYHKISNPVTYIRKFIPHAVESSEQLDFINSFE